MKFHLKYWTIWNINLLFNQIKSLIKGINLGFLVIYRIILVINWNFRIEGILVFGLLYLNQVCLIKVYLESN